MSNLTTITLSSGNVTNSGTFSTLDNSFGTAGTSNANVASVQGISGGTAITVTGPITISGTSDVFVVNGVTTVAVSGTSNVSVVSGGITSVVVSGTSNVSVINSVSTLPGNTATSPLFVQDLDAGNVVTGVAATGSSSLSATGVLFSIDTTGYQSASISVTSAGTSCTISYEGSNDNSTWAAIFGINQTINTAGSIAASLSTAVGNYCFPAMTRYIRARVSTYTSGTVTAFYSLRNIGITPGVQPVSIVNAANGSLGTISTNFVAAATGGYTYSHIPAGQTTTVVKSGSGTLHSVTFWSAATTLNVTTIYDSASASGNVIAIPAATAITTPGSALLDVAFTTGLTISSATANGSDMTIAFK